MVVDNRNLMRGVSTPPEANSPLIVDPNAVLTDARTSELLETIARRDPQVVEPNGRIELP